MMNNGLVIFDLLRLLVVMHQTCISLAVVGLVVVVVAAAVAPLLQIWGNSRALVPWDTEFLASRPVPGRGVVQKGWH